MAAGQRRTEVLDSEHEPMTSSPIGVSDGAADKLCAAAPVALQETQDALHEATRPHQANAENTAKSPIHRAGGLDADQENASTNDVAPTDMQPAGEAATSAEGRIVDVHHNEVTPFPETTSTLPDAQVANLVSHPAAVTSSTTSDDQRETKQAMTTQRLETTNPSTDVTPLNPESTCHIGGTENEVVPSPETAALPSAPDQAGSSTDDLKPEESSLTGIEEHPDQDDIGLTNDQPKQSESSALHSVDSTPEDSRMEGTLSEDVSSTVYRQNSKHDTNAQMTNDRTSQAAAQTSVNGHVEEHPVCPRAIHLLSACLHFHRLHPGRAKTSSRTARMKMWTWR
jgi:hypothetical protein